MESGWVEYLRNWTILIATVCLCVGPSFWNREGRSYKGDKWNNGEMLEGEDHGEGKGNCRRKAMGPTGGQSV